MNEATTENEPRSAGRAGQGDFLLISGRFDGADVRLRMVPLAREIRIGRSKGPESAGSWNIDHVTVSRRHARITPEEAGIHIEDCGSRNGTWVDGSVLRGQKARLDSGSTIVLG